MREAKMVNKAIVMAAVGGLCLAGSHARAVGLYWDGTATPGAWETAANWSTSSTDTTPDPSSAPTATDDVYFNVAGGSLAETITLSGNRAARSLTFSNTGTTTLQKATTGGSVSFTLTDGITLSSGAGGVTIGGSNNTVVINLNGSQTWTNNASNALRIYNAFRGADSVSSTLTLTGSGSGGFIFSNTLSDGASGGVVSLLVDLQGSGTLTSSSNANSFTGGATIKSGTVSVRPGFFGTGEVLLGDNTAGATSNATLGLAEGGAIANNITVRSGSSGAMTLSVAGSKTVTASGALTLNRGLALSLGTSSVTTFSGKITGNGGLSKSSSGTLTLTNADNDYSGGTAVAGGVLNLGSNKALGTGALTVTATATVRSDSDSQRQLSNGLILNNTANAVLSLGSVTAGYTGNLAFGSLSIEPTSTFTKTIAVNNASTTFTSYSATGSTGVTVNGSGSLIISGNYDANANIAVAAPIVAVGGAVSGTGNITLSGGVFAANGTIARVIGTSTGGSRVAWETSSGGTNGGFAAYGGDLAVNLNSGDALTWGGTSVANFIRNGKTLILGHSLATHTVDFQNPLNLNALTQTVQVDDGSAAVDAKLSGALSNGSLTKTGNGILELTASSPGYTGITTVSGGKLVVTGSIAGSAVTVASGAALSGTGTVGALTVQGGGLLTPGNSPGMLTVNGSLALAASSTSLFELGSLQSDKVVGITDASFGGTLDVVLAGATLDVGSTFDLFDWSGNSSGQFALISLPTLGSGMTWQLWTAPDNSLQQFNYATGQIAVVGIPEPTTITMVMMLGASVVVARRRRVA